MTTIVSPGACARLTPSAARHRSCRPAQPDTVTQPAACQSRGTVLLARWSIDPETGRLRCAWGPEDHRDPASLDHLVAEPLAA